MRDHKLRVEFHCHTAYSKDSLTRPDRLLAACRRKGIDRIVITDHNTLAGALRAKELDPERVVVGVELMTTVGELLAAYVSAEIPAGLPPEEAIASLRAQGAFISVAHPFDRMRKGHWRAEELLRVLPQVDAIETFNARCLWPVYNRRAQAFAREHGVLGTVGSDAHTLGELGQAVMDLEPFHDAASLKAALVRAEPRTKLSGPWVHLYTRYAVWRKKRMRLKGSP